MEQRLLSALPPDWRVRKSAEEPIPGDSRPDLVLEVLAPDGRRATLAVEAKSRLQTRDVVRQIDRWSSSAQRTKRKLRRAVPVLVAPFITDRSRAALEAAGWSYADLTGNTLLRLDAPALFVRLAGATKDPWPPTDTPVRSLKGPKTARLVRALCDYRPPLRLRALAERAGVDPGYTSRVLRFLDSEDLIERSRSEGISRVNWRGLIERWTKDYSVLETNFASSYLEPRGLPRFLESLREADLDLAVSGSLAASRLVSVAPARLALVYVGDAQLTARKANLRPADAGANVVLLEPFDGVVFERARVERGITYVATSQLAADLLTGPGRDPSEGQELLGWMERNEPAWRS